MKSILIAAAALAGLTAVPAIAATPATSTTSKADKSTLTNADPDQRYCLSDTPTGSRIPREVCKTRADWAADGVDVNQLDR